jgi:hypothetical protein
MRMKLSGFPLCKAGDWGLQPPEKCFCFGFFAAKPQQHTTSISYLSGFFHYFVGHWRGCTRDKPMEGISTFTFCL